MRFGATTQIEVDPLSQALCLLFVESQIESAQGAPTNIDSSFALELIGQWLVQRVSIAVEDGQGVGLAMGMGQDAERGPRCGGRIRVPIDEFDLCPCLCQIIGCRTANDAGADDQDTGG